MMLPRNWHHNTTRWAGTRAIKGPLARHTRSCIHHAVDTLNAERAALPLAELRISA